MKFKQTLDDLKGLIMQCNDCKGVARPCHEHKQKLDTETMRLAQA